MLHSDLFWSRLGRSATSLNTQGWQATAWDGSPGLGRVAFDVKKANTDIHVEFRFAQPNLTIFQCN
ncbi:hypothetical protein ACQFX9_00945 [Aliinostoc sp. HNIBRCY26]|uniref:hypothetical protein n=1 Tax=Aliinostoc sp. HNIBRCY26 TaxID=3418997 RepID=UPI003CFBD472